MQPWAATMILGGYAQAELLGQLCEGVASCISSNPAATLGDEEGLSWWYRKDATSSFGIPFQCVYRGGMNWHTARFSKLRPLDMKDSTIEVDIRLVQAECFVHSHPCCHQQTEESPKRAPAESLARQKLLAIAEQSLDLLVAIDVRRLASATMREKSCRRNFGARFGGAVPDGEAPDSAQTPSPLSRMGVGRLSGPEQRQFCGDVRGTLGSEKRHKIP